MNFWKKIFSFILAISFVIVFPSLAVSSETPGTFASWPVQGEIINPFKLPANPYTSGGHRGIDIQAATGTEVVAVEEGTVAFWSTNQGENGMMISIDHPNGLTTTYLHLSEIFSEAKGKGKEVTAGQSIGKVGTTGNPSSSIPHLHFGVFRTESRAKSSYEYIDPALVLPSLVLSTEPLDNTSTSAVTTPSLVTSEPTAAGEAESPLSPNPSAADGLVGTESASTAVKPNPYEAVPAGQKVSGADQLAATGDTAAWQSSSIDVPVQSEPVAVSPAASAPVNQESVSRPPEPNTPPPLVESAPENPATVQEAVDVEQPPAKAYVPTAEIRPDSLNQTAIDISPAPISTMKLKTGSRDAESVKKFPFTEGVALRKDEMLWAALFILILTSLIHLPSLSSQKFTNHWTLRPAFL